MTLRNRALSLAAPFVIAMAWDTLRLGARVVGLYKTFQQNPSLFNGAEAMAHLERAIAEHMAWQDDQDRRAA